MFGEGGALGLVEHLRMQREQGAEHATHGGRIIGLAEEFLPQHRLDLDAQGAPQFAGKS